MGKINFGIETTYNAMHMIIILQPMVNILS